jgi:hypothetical protein
MKTILTLFFAVFATACIAGEDPLVASESEVDSSLRMQSPARPLPDWSTGTNSATVGDGLLFDEVNTSGPNPSGLRIDHARLGTGTAVRFFVLRHTLKAQELLTGREYSGADLLDATIKLRHDASGREYELKITGVNTKALQFWAGPAEDVPFYELKARRTDTTGEKPFEYICKKDLLTADPDWIRLAHSALVFQGDVYDPHAKTVTTVDESDPRFNLACANTAPAKMHLTRHTRAGSINDTNAIVYPTTVKQRQAMLKMLTADYCGTGTSFTVDGQALTYADAWTEFPRWPEATAVEALWDYQGARCLNTPRRGAEVMAEITATCGKVLPPCPPLAEGYQPNIVISQLLPH